MNLAFYTVEAGYCDYLRKFDKCVPYTMERKSTRPFIGIVLQVNDYKYYAPLSSPKPKHLKMKNQIDFLKISGGSYGAINFNNMIPITDNVAHKVNPNALNRSYDNNAYRNLLNNQLSWCNSNKDAIISHAKSLYERISKGTANQALKSRCCNFKLLEEKSLEYIQAQRQMQQPILPNQIPDTGGFTQNMK